MNVHCVGGRVECGSYLALLLPRRVWEYFLPTFKKLFVVAGLVEEALGNDVIDGPISPKPAGCRGDWLRP